MNAKIRRTYGIKFNKANLSLRAAMLVQGIMWLIAAAGLFLLPEVKSVNMILMSVLGILFIGWSLFIDRPAWSSRTRITKVDFELDSRSES